MARSCPRLFLEHRWGDIDTHGFAILDQLRGILDSVQSLLMDRETLFAFLSQWGREADNR